MKKSAQVTENKKDREKSRMQKAEIRMAGGWTSRKVAGRRTEGPGENAVEEHNSC